MTTLYLAYRKYSFTGVTRKYDRGIWLKAFEDEVILVQHGILLLFIKMSNRNAKYALMELS